MSVAPLSNPTADTSVNPAQVIFHYFGLPYDCSSIQACDIASECFVILSNHLIFVHTSLGFYILVLTKFGAQFVSERAAAYPESIYAKKSNIIPYSINIILENCIMKVTGSSVYLAHTAGPLFRMEISVKNDEVTSLSISSVAILPTVITCMSLIPYNDRDLMFVGSQSSCSLLYDVTGRTVTDTLLDQSSAQCLQRLSYPEDTSLVYAHGFAHPLIPNLTGRNLIASARTTDTCVLNPFFLSKSQTLQYNLVRSLHWKSQFDSMVVLSSTTSTVLYSIKETLISIIPAEESPILLNTHTVDVAVLPASLWGGSEDKDVIVQVYDTGVRVSDESKVICDIKQVSKVR